MSVDDKKRSDQESVWPMHAGVNGVSLFSESASEAQRTGNSAIAALAVWTAESEVSAIRTGRWAAGFPFRPVLDHYRTVGRDAAAAPLVAALADCLRTAEGGEAQDRSDRRLPLFLRSVIDQPDSDYHSYAGTTLHEAFLHEAPYGSRESTADALIVTLLLDLLRTEAEALAHTPGDPQRRRTQAVVRAVEHAHRLAPEAARVADTLSATLDALRRHAPDEEVAEHALKAVDNAPRCTEAEEVSRLTMVPATPLHDEYMFLRSIQLFECVYLRSAWQFEEAAGALVGGSPQRCAARLTAAAERLEAVPALYRVLTTMPREAFAIIREHTGGRSAIQSVTYRLVEWNAAPRPGTAPPGATSRTVQDAFLRVAQELPAPSAAAVRAAMLRTAQAWQALKRSHWGITLKVIGNVPGTGGTEGARYLQKTSQIPLFPALADQTRPSATGSVE